jgi:alpha-tubulin suppressor-like RCC1 family protein
MVLHADGKLDVFGTNPTGVLKPHKKVKDGAKIVAIAAGKNHALALSDGGEVCADGRAQCFALVMIASASTSAFMDWCCHTLSQP